MKNCKCIDNVIIYDDNYYEYNPSNINQQQNYLSYSISNTIQIDKKFNQIKPIEGILLWTEHNLPINIRLEAKDTYISIYDRNKSKKDDGYISIQYNDISIKYNLSMLMFYSEVLSFIMLCDNDVSEFCNFIVSMKEEDNDGYNEDQYAPYDTENDLYDYLNNNENTIIPCRYPSQLHLIKPNISLEYNVYFKYN